MTHSERTTVIRKLVKICSFPLRVIMIVEADTWPGSQVVHTGFDFIIKIRVLIMLQEWGHTNHIISSVI